MAPPTPAPIAAVMQVEAVGEEGRSDERRGRLESESFLVLGRFYVFQPHLLLFAEAAPLRTVGFVHAMRGFTHQSAADVLPPNAAAEADGPRVVPSIPSFFPAQGTLVRPGQTTQRYTTTAPKLARGTSGSSARLPAPAGAEVIWGEVHHEPDCSRTGRLLAGSAV
jgi:hypothetical protein